MGASFSFEKKCINIALDCSSHQKYTSLLLIKRTTFAFFIRTWVICALKTQQRILFIIHILIYFLSLIKLCRKITRYVFNDLCTCWLNTQTRFEKKCIFIALVHSTSHRKNDVTIKTLKLAFGAAAGHAMFTSP